MLWIGIARMGWAVITAAITITYAAKRAFITPPPAVEFDEKMVVVSITITMNFVGRLLTQPNHSMKPAAPEQMIASRLAIDPVAYLFLVRRSPISSDI